MHGKLGDLPTMKVEPTMLENYARKADTAVRGSSSAGSSSPAWRSTARFPGSAGVTSAGVTCTPAEPPANEAVCDRRIHRGTSRKAQMATMAR